MSSPAVPATPAAAPSAPASPAPSSAPSSAPATPAPAAPVAPAPPVPPASAPAAPAAAPAAPAAPAAGAPKPEDYPANQDGVEQFIEANEKWKAEHPDEAAKAAEAAAKEAEGRAPGAQPEEVKPAEAPKPEEPKAPEAAKPAGELPTPQEFDSLLAAKPAFKALFDADPEAKTAVMDLARAVEAARPIIDMLPTVAEAEFAVKTGNQFLDLQHKFAMSTEVPEVGEQGFKDFVNLFQIVDDKGQPVMENGAPVMAPSFDFLSKKLTTGAITNSVTSAKAEADRLAAQVANGTFPSEEAKEAARTAAVDADYKYKALKYVGELLAQDDEGPGLPDLPADATPAQRAFQDELKRQQEALKQTKTTATKEARVKERVAFERHINGQWGDGVGEYVENEIKARRDRGEALPDLILQQTWINPVTQQATKIPRYAAEIYNEFNAKVHSIPTVHEKLLNLELQGPQAKAARLEYFKELRTLYLPKITDKYFSALSAGLKQMSDQSRTKQEKVAEVARVEPQTGGTPATPQALTGDSLTAKVLENLKDNPEYKAAGRTEKAEMEIIERERIRAGR
jgi:hypothetical protein